MNLRSSLLASLFLLCFLLTSFGASACPNYYSGISGLDIPSDHPALPSCQDAANGFTFVSGLDDEFSYTVQCFCAGTPNATWRVIKMRQFQAQFCSPADLAQKWEVAYTQSDVVQDDVVVGCAVILRGYTWEGWSAARWGNYSCFEQNCSCQTAQRSSNGSGYSLFSRRIENPNTDTNQQLPDDECAATHHCTSVHKWDRQAGCAYDYNKTAKTYSVDTVIVAPPFPGTGFHTEFWMRSETTTFSGSMVVGQEPFCADGSSQPSGYSVVPMTPSTTTINHC